MVIRASSKASIGLGYALADGQNAPKSLGMTSSRNLEILSNLSTYDNTMMV
ncbi:MAG: hypothetical protein ACI81A_001778 [Paraglaciecola sp.]